MRREVRSSGQMVRRIVRCVELGYWYYVVGWIPERKDPEKTERKLVGQYEIREDRTALYRDKAVGRAKVRLYRFRRFFILLATEGEHPIFQGERMTDIRGVPLRYNGVTIRYVNGRARVAWSEGVYRRLRCGFLKAALGQAGRLEQRMAAIRHPLYPDITRQKERIIRVVMKRRKRAGKEKIFVEGIK